VTLPGCRWGPGPCKQWIGGLSADNDNRMPNAKQEAYAGRVEKVLSSDRLGRYAASPGEPRWEALARYAWNVALCEAFYPLLHHFEIVLRNQVFAAGQAAYPVERYRDVDCWLDATPSPLHPRYGVSSVEKAKQKLCGTPGRGTGRSRRTLCPGDLVAALEFGFWTGMFSTFYLWQSGRDQRLWPHRLHAVFPHGPRLTRVQAVSGALNEIRHLRNRIFHHEPVWRRPDLAGERARILEMLAWMSPETARTVRELDRVPRVLSESFRRELRFRIYRESRG
jgi:hypothetical protein